MNARRLGLFLSHSFLCSSLLLPALLLAACGGEEDTTPPAPPWVDDMASPTRLAEPRLCGTAEFGSTVTVRGGAEEVQTVADPYTARWCVDVPLAEGPNALSVTATDAAGNESDPTDVDIEYIEPPGPPAEVMITGPASVRAGEPATFEVTVLDVFGDPIPDPSYMLSTDAPDGTTGFDAPATYTFCDVGTWTVTAQVGTDGPSASTAIDVTLGRPSMLSLSTTPSPAVVTAGETVSYETEVRDTCGNVTDDYVSVYTNAPGALAADGTVSGLTRAGEYVLVAEVPGTGLVDTESILVGADADSVAVRLVLAAHTGLVDVPIGYEVIAVDGYGNPIATPPTIEVPTDSGATIDTTTHTITFSSTGTQTVTATVEGVSDSDYIVITNPDRTAPDVTIDVPPIGRVYAPGDTVTVQVTATDDRGLAQIIFEASGEASYYRTRLVPNDASTGAPYTAYTTLFEFDIPDRFALGPIVLVAQAVDTSGNHRSSDTVVVQVDPAARLTPAAGFTVETITGRDLLNRPRGLTVDAAGDIFVANNSGDASVVQVAPGSGTQSAFTPSIGGAWSEDIVYYPTDGTFFLTTGGNDRIYRIDASGVATDFTGGAFGSSPRGVIVDSGTSVSVLWRNGTIRRFDPADTFPATPTFVMFADPPLRGSAWGLVQVGSRYAATDRGTDEAWRFDPPGSTFNDVQNLDLIAEQPPLNAPHDIVLAASSGNLYVANENDGRIIRIEAGSCTTSPCPTGTIVSGMNAPWGLVFEAADSLLVTDEQDDILYRIRGSF